MFINRFRSLYSLRFTKPASLVPLSYTRRTQYFSTESKSDLKPEDTFGTYSSDVESHSAQDYEEDDAKGSDIRIPEAITEIKKHIRRYNLHSFWGHQFVKYISEEGMTPRPKVFFDQAKEVFDELKKSKRPPPYIYKLLFISAARLGKVEEAYKLYNDLKKRGYYADGAMFTSLFYACAKCHRRDIALPIADKLMTHMFNSKNDKPNTTNFNVMLMAYGRHGDISTVMQIIDRLEDEGRVPSIQTFNFALDSCISQPNTGLRFAILIWHHLRRKKKTPNVYTFLTLARCVRDCSLGDSDLCEGFINSLFVNRPRKEISQGPKTGGLVIDLEKKSQTFSESDQSGRDVKELGSYPNNNESKESGMVLCMENSQAEMVQPTRDVTLNNEDDEKTEQPPRSVEAESSDNFGPGAGSNEESQCVTRNDIAAAEKAVTLTAGNDEGLIDLSIPADGSQLTEVKSADEFKSEAATHRIDNADLPNVLTLKPPGKSIIHYGDFSVPENRLMLFGGLNGFLETVKSFNVKPNIQLFSILLECIPSNEEDEQALMSEMKKSGVKVDTTFLNTLIKRRILRNKESTPEDFLKLFKIYRRAPDAVTFGTIACSCVTHESGKKCIELARSHNIRLNSVILRCLLKRAGRTGDMAYVSDILKAAKEDDTELDAKFVTTLKYIVESEKRRRSEERRKSISQ